MQLLYKLAIILDINVCDILTPVSEIKKDFPKKWKL
jgi:hypothetical protein